MGCHVCALARLGLPCTPYVLKIHTYYLQGRLRLDHLGFTSETDAIGWRQRDNRCVITAEGFQWLKVPVRENDTDLRSKGAQNQKFCLCQGTSRLTLKAVNGLDEAYLGCGRQSALPRGYYKSSNGI